MTWDKITLGQFQELSKALQTEDDPFERDFRAVCIMYRLPEKQVNSMEKQQFDQLVRGLDFLHTEQIPYKPVKAVKINGKRYRFIYDVRKIRAARYIEAKAFEGAGLIANLHKVAASMAMPQRRILGIWCDRKYDSSLHADYAKDLQDAPIVAVHSSVVFFCKVFATSMLNLRPYLREEMTKTGKMTPSQIEEAITHLCSLMDGYTRQQSSQIMNA